MYPQPELSRGTARKAAVRRSIARRRAQCVHAAGAATMPLALLDRLMVHWRELAPYAGIAVVALSLRRKPAASARPGLLRKLVRWVPIVSGILHLFRATGRKR